MFKISYKWVRYLNYFNPDARNKWSLKWNLAFHDNKCIHMNFFGHFLAFSLVICPITMKSLQMMHILVCFSDVTCIGLINMITFLLKYIIILAYFIVYSQVLLPRNYSIHIPPLLSLSSSFVTSAHHARTLLSFSRETRGEPPNLVSMTIYINSGYRSWMLSLKLLSLMMWFEYIHWYYVFTFRTLPAWNLYI